MIVYFIRHGRPEYPRDVLGRQLVYGPSAELSRGGAERIRVIARAIQKREPRKFDWLITSPYTRAKETTQVFAEIMQLDPTKILEDPRVRDTDSTWPGEPLDLFLDVWRERKVFIDTHILETLEDLRARMTSVVNEHTQQYQGQMIGFIGHGDPFRAWLLPPEKTFSSYADLVNATFESAEGIRAVFQEDGRMETEIIQDFMSWL